MYNKTPLLSSSLSSYSLQTSNSLTLPCVDQVIKKGCSKETEQDKEQKPKPPSSGGKEMKRSASS